MFTTGPGEQPHCFICSCLHEVANAGSMEASLCGVYFLMSSKCTLTRAVCFIYMRRSIGIYTCSQSDHKIERLFFGSVAVVLDRHRSFIVN